MNDFRRSTSWRIGTRSPELGEPDLLRLQCGVPEDVLFLKQVALPPGGRGEIEVERFSGWCDYFAAGQDHSTGEGPCGAAYHGDPIASSELNWVWIVVDVYVRKRTKHVFHHLSMC